MNQSSNNKFLAYVRVSTKDQQEHGTSLTEQRGYIERYAESKGFVIEKFYIEAESASKAGRQKFAEMLKDLTEGGYKGIIFHKTDRSARNPTDQAVLYELMQKGFEFHFVLEGTSTAEPNGRYVMYLLWGMASGYTENLRAEINKGILGRLKMGRVPAQVPIGYNKAEECRAIIDPMRAPMVRQILREYASGRYSVQMITKRGQEIGLMNRNGRYLNKSSMHALLRQPFYYGLIRHRKGFFNGDHEPLIPKALFDRVQYFLTRKGFKRKYAHEYIFTGGMLKCPECKVSLKSMTAKGKFKYYYCRNKECSVKALSEKKISDQALEHLRSIEFNDMELDGFKKALRVFQEQTNDHKREQMRAVNLELNNIQARLDGLVNKLVEQTLDDETFGKMRKALLDKQLELRERRDALERTDTKKLAQLETFGKLLKSPSLAYQKADVINKRRLLVSMTENLELTPNGLAIKWKKAFEMVANRPKPKSSAPGRNRTCIASFGGRHPIR